MRLVEALAFARDALTQVGVSSPDADAYWLLSHATQLSRGEIQTRMSFDFELSQHQSEVFMSALEQRLKRIPLQHITGRAAFLDFELEVGKGVFIPRPETEAVAMLGIEFLMGLDHSSKALDIGSGSGAIAISMARAVPNSSIAAIELSEEAAKYTKKNIEKLAPSVELIIGDFTAEAMRFIGQLNLVISNPPYIPIHAVPIDVEVRDHDPELALYGGLDGLDIVREIIELSPVLLKPGGALVLEHADGQSDAIRELLLAQGFSEVIAHSDLAGRLRSISARI